MGGLAVLPFRHVFRSPEPEILPPLRKSRLLGRRAPSMRPLDRRAIEMESRRKQGLLDQRRPVRSDRAMLPSVPSKTQYSGSMLLVDVALLPVRASIVGVRVTVMASQWVRPDGPLRRENGLIDMADVIVGKNGVAEQVMTLLSNPYGPVALLRAITSATSPERPLGKAIQDGGIVDSALAPDGMVDRVFQSGGFVERVVMENGLAERMLALLENMVAIAPTIEGLQDPLARIESASRYITEAAEPLTDLAARLPRPRFPRVAWPNGVREDLVEPPVEVKPPSRGKAAPEPAPRTGKRPPGKS
ncbi:hypothetical protein [Lolliginicoccus levis]|uniref:hypothetical protein n=1 Tax=Lolliginicoccus levis TaxID=2919542 RepID=UPI002420346E|nr:hypothetical protein [Lolliginicoccus levis]